jgi:small subunit ribosomal protein S6
MAAHVYECMFLLDTTKVAGDVPATAKHLQTILEKHHAEILASRPWDERRLAYPIRGQKKGLYYLTYFRTEVQNLPEIQRDMALNETVLRSLTIHVDPKHVDTMLAIARDEHALALQMVPDSGDDDLGGGRDDRDGGDRPRRGGRRYDDKSD